MSKKSFSKFLKKAWYFIWEDDSLLSWVVNVVLAFLIIKFLVYPGMGLLLGTGYPVVAVVSGSMEHNSDFSSFWKLQHTFYDKLGITESDFESFNFKNGFNKGDIIILRAPKNIKVGNVIVFQQRKPDPIIHRVVKVWKDEQGTHYQTKGDNNLLSISTFEINEMDIPEKLVVGKAFFRIPFLGWVKIAFFEFIQIIRGAIF